LPADPRPNLSPKPSIMYETILSRLNALSASFGMIRESQKVRPGDNPWGYSGGVRDETLREREKVVKLLEKEATSDIKWVESTSTMVEKPEVGRT